MIRQEVTKQTGDEELQTWQNRAGRQLNTDNSVLLGKIHTDQINKNINQSINQ